jgi:hypothetical protein
VIILAATVLAVLSVPLSGASLAPLGHLPLRWSWTVWVAIIVQTVLSMMTVANWIGEPLHLLTFALAAAFLWGNRRLPGIALFVLGGGLNLLAIAANGGTMPASEAAWRRAGLPIDTAHFENSNIVDHARLPWLGDVFAIPKGWPLANVFSIGDVIVVVAIVYFLHVWCRRRVVMTPVAAEPVLVVTG